MVLTLSLSGNTSDDRNDGQPLGAIRPVADVDAGLAYHRRGRRIDFDFNGQSVVRRSETSITPLRQQGMFDVSVSGLRQQFHINQSASYAPSYEFGGLTDVSDAPEIEAAHAHGDFANADVAALTVNSDVDWSRVLSRRFTLSAGYGFRRTAFRGAALDMTSQDAGMTLARRLTRYSSLRAGYTYRMATSALTPGQPLRVHDVDAGIDYGRPVALSKRTTLTFSSGSSLVPVGGRPAFNVTGEAGLARRMGRTWNARLGVARRVRLVEGFAAPVLDNVLTTTLGGNLRRRVSLSASGSLSTGTVGLENRSRNGYANWTATSGVGIAMGRRTMLDLHYFCIGQRYNGGVVLPRGLENRRLRQGLRLGVTVRAPLLG